MQIKYNEDIRPDIDTFPQATIGLGLMILAEERGVYYDGDQIQSSNPGMECFTAAVSTFLGILDIQAIYADFASGTVGKQTIVRSLKLMGKRAALGFALGWVLIEVGDCFGWW